MTTNQIELFTLFAALFGFLIWGRIRYDLVAFVALLIAVLLNLVEPDAAFEGFGHPAVVIIAMVLIVSRGLINSGAVELIGRWISKTGRPLPTHISIMALTGAALSAVMNNVAALALLMSLDMDAARKAKRAVSLSLMPLSFGTILGGMITLIGTPPNIVIAQFRAEAIGAPYSMFDFAPVGGVIALVGVAYVALIGWRLIPERDDTLSDEGDGGLYVAEGRVKAKSKAAGQPVSDLYPKANDCDVTILGLIRNHKRLPGFSRDEEIKVNDVLVLEGDPKQIEAFVGAAGLELASADKNGGLLGKSLTLIECIVPDDARIVGRTSMDLRLLQRQGIELVGAARQGKRFRDRVRKLKIRRGDTLLFVGPEDRLPAALAWLGVLPLANRQTEVVQRSKAFAAIGAFAFAVFLSVIGVTSLDVSLGLCVVSYLALGLIGRDFYELIEWKVIVLLACLIPLSTALETSGTTALIADFIVAKTLGAPPWIILTAVLVVTMTLSDFLNNVATALIAAPIAVDVALAIDVSPDPFLMGVAVASSCAFLTPIGHKNNTIIMGPGNYRFGDYWRMGLVLELIVIIVAVPMLLWVWPLNG